MARLSVNIDHIATLRQARLGKEPDPVTAASIVELAGADGITVHLREDRRHIQDRDVRLLRETVKTRLNLEMAATEEMINIAIETKPDMVTLVPEKRAELTTEGGLDVIINKESLSKQVSILKDGGITVSLFINPEIDQVKGALRVGADYVEVHTGRYADAVNKEEGEIEFGRILDAVKVASKLRLGINAGHGLNYINIKKISKISEIEEFSIGHSIIARAALVGLDRAVREMAELVKVNQAVLKQPL
ncbi:MAG: pyridoxine 5'-phosphate synthase [Deltaproteobacteria bacterium GWA2_47_9]|nr:MAG: pyridoxine 5'-phosphate synthase [Deltaproteobacteria bacterium GWA2_47_9]